MAQGPSQGRCEIEMDSASYWVSMAVFPQVQNATYVRHIIILWNFCRSEVQAGLVEFSAYGFHKAEIKVSGLGSCLKALGENPLPHSFRLLIEFCFCCGCRTEVPVSLLSAGGWSLLLHAALFLLVLSMCCLHPSSNNRLPSHALSLQLPLLPHL